MSRWRRSPDRWDRPSAQEIADLQREIDRDRELRIKSQHVKCADGWTRRRDDQEKGA